MDPKWILHFYYVHVPFHVFQPSSQVEGDPLDQQELWSHKKKQAVVVETSALALVL